ncbi:MAG: 4'-phosphopantetheinyl transferase superfamily protein [Deltaproteobacteria bacterium]|nr:4'-phosphopantetheinyl transferase superfamily protein [Deltaproteobacteria bacterium]
MSESFHKTLNNWLKDQFGTGLHARGFAIQNLPEDTKAKALQSLSPQEQTQWQDFSDLHKRREQWLLARLAAKICYTDSLQDQGTRPSLSQIEIIKNQSGKPFLQINKKPLATALSITHTDEYVVAATSQNTNKFGIDLEIKTRPIGDWIGRAFSRKESQMLKDCSPTQLLRCWTAKEAASKAFGTGLHGRWHAWQVAEFDSDQIIIKFEDHEFKVRTLETEAFLFSVCGE